MSDLNHLVSVLIDLQMILVIVLGDILSAQQSYCLVEFLEFAGDLGDILDVLVYVLGDDHVMFSVTFSDVLGDFLGDFLGDDLAMFLVTIGDVVGDVLSVLGCVWLCVRVRHHHPVIQQQQPPVLGHWRTLGPQRPFYQSNLGLQHQHSTHFVHIFLPRAPLQVVLSSFVCP